MFTQDTQKEIEIDALEFGYNQMYLEEINKLKEENRSKDEKIKADNIVNIKNIMHNFNVDFDSAFSTLNIDSSLKEEYRKLIEEKTLSR